MIDWLYTVPDLAAVSIFVGIVVVVIVVVPRLVRRAFGLKRNDDAADYAIRAQGTLITACIFVLGFSLVQAQQTYHRVENQVSTEATLINQLDRLLVRYGEPKLEDVRQQLHSYARSIVADEWPELRRGKGSDKTRQAFGPVSRGVLAIEPGPGRQSAIYADMLKKVDELSEVREQRIEASNDALPAVFWRVIIGLLVLMTVMACLIEQTVARTIGMAGQAVAVTALLSLVFISDRPFLGQTSVGPDDIVKVITTMEARKN